MCILIIKHMYFVCCRDMLRTVLLCEVIISNFSVICPCLSSENESYAGTRLSYRWHLFSVHHWLHTKYTADHHHRFNCCLTSAPKTFKDQPDLAGKLKPRLHQIHVAGYKYPGRATCIRIQVDTCRRNAASTTILSPIQDTCRCRCGIVGS